MTEREHPYERHGLRLALIFGPVMVLAVVMLILDVLRAFLLGISQAIYNALSAMIEWSAPLRANKDTQA